jgi:TonB family protein
MPKGKLRRVKVGRARMKALILVGGVLVNSAGSVGTAGQTHDRKNGLPDVLKATEIIYPVNTTATGMVAFLVTLDADGIVKNSQILQDIPPLTTAAQEGMKNWTFKAGTFHGKPAPSLLPVYVVFNPYNPAGTAPIGGALSIPTPLSPGGWATFPPQVRMASYALYPANSLATGTVVLSVHIDKSGHLSDIREVHGAHPLMEAAVEEVKQWGFQPSRSGDQPVAGSICIAFVFQRNLS